jgi:uncharacterized membrane protein YqjE
MTGHAAGPIALLGAAGRTALDIVCTRVELISVEIAQEQAHLARLALYAAVAVMATGLGLQMAALIAVVWLWDTPYRLAAVTGGAGVFAAAGAVCAVAFARKLRSKPSAFGTTLRALQADVEALR